MSLYFNLEDDEERRMWEHIDSKKKSQYIKRLILNDMNGISIPASLPKSNVEICEDDSDFKVHDLEVKVDDSEELVEFPEGL